jgi:hypothetical protein
MSINFPDTPFAGLTYSYGNSIWEWNGSSWVLYASNVRLPENFTSIPNNFTATQAFTAGITSTTGIFTNPIQLLSGLCASGGVTLSGPVEFDSLARFDAGFTASGNIYFHGCTLGSTDGRAPKYFARAWVNFNGTAVSPPRGSGNVSSITDNGGQGAYTINFIQPMPDTNYCVLITNKPSSGAISTASVRQGTYATFVTTASVAITCVVPATTPHDPEMVNVVIFR